MYFLHFAFAIEQAKLLEEGLPANKHIRFPRLSDWQEMIPAVGRICSSDHSRDRWQHFFYAFLEGKKISNLREAELKNLLLSTQYDHYNEHVYFEEWDVLLPHMLRMYLTDLREYQDYLIFHLRREQSGPPRVQSVGFMASTTFIDSSLLQNKAQGAYAVSRSDREHLLPLSPFCEYAECKLHRKKEFFVYAGLILKQEMLPPLPVYYGKTITCEPVLHRDSVEWFRRLIDGERDNAEYPTPTPLSYH